MKMFLSDRQRPLTVFQKMKKQKLIEDVLQKEKKKPQKPKKTKREFEYTMTWDITNSAEHVSHTIAI